MKLGRNLAAGHSIFQFQGDRDCRIKNADFNIV